MLNGSAKICHFFKKHFIVLLLLLLVSFIPASYSLGKRITTERTGASNALQHCRKSREDVLGEVIVKTCNLCWDLYLPPFLFHQSQYGQCHQSQYGHGYLGSIDSLYFLHCLMRSLSVSSSDSELLLASCTGSSSLTKGSSFLVAFALLQLSFFSSRKDPLADLST